MQDNVQVAMVHSTTDGEHVLQPPQPAAVPNAAGGRRRQRTGNDEGL